MKSDLPTSGPTIVESDDRSETCHDFPYFRHDRFEPDSPVPPAKITMDPSTWSPLSSS